MKKKKITPSQLTGLFPAVKVGVQGITLAKDPVQVATARAALDVYTGMVSDGHHMVDGQALSSKILEAEETLLASLRDNEVNLSDEGMEICLKAIAAGFTFTGVRHGYNVYIGPDQQAQLDARQQEFVDWLATPEGQAKANALCDLHQEHGTLTSCKSRLSSKGGVASLLTQFGFSSPVTEPFREAIGAFGSRAIETA